MSGIASRNFDQPDETRAPEKTKVEIVDLNGSKAARLTLQPGWRWSECIKPVVGGESCQAKHFGFASTGTMHVVHEDGTESDITGGDAYLIDPGHDAWVVGDETYVAYEFESATAASFARIASAESSAS